MKKYEDLNEVELLEYQRLRCLAMNRFRRFVCKAALGFAVTQNLDPDEAYEAAESLANTLDWKKCFDTWIPDSETDDFDSV